MGFGLIRGEHVGKEGCRQLQPSCFATGPWGMRCDGWTDVMVGCGVPGKSLLGRRMERAAIGSRMGHIWSPCPTATPSRGQSISGDALGDTQ